VSKFSPGTSGALVRLALFSGFVLACTGPALADDGEQGRSQQQDTATLAGNRALERQMQLVASWLNDYTTRNQRWPMASNDVRWCTAQLVQLVPMNPYASVLSSVEQASFPGPASGMSLSPQAMNQMLPWDEDKAENAAINSGKIQWAQDIGVNKTNLRDYLKNPPDSWQANPGTITIVSNLHDMFLVWGADKDGRPLRDSLTGTPIYVVGNFTWLGDQSDD